MHMLDAAAEGGYTYPAVNVSSSETLNAALRGFAEAESDGIVEATYPPDQLDTFVRPLLAGSVRRR
jgi:fructose/tagatose bisphosphate aldolase